MDHIACRVRVSTFATMNMYGSVHSGAGRACRFVKYVSTLEARVAVARAKAAVKTFAESHSSIARQQIWRESGEVQAHSLFGGHDDSMLKSNGSVIETDGRGAEEAAAALFGTWWRCSSGSERGKRKLHWNELGSSFFLGLHTAQVETVCCVAKALGHMAGSGSNLFAYTAAPHLLASVNRQLTLRAQSGMDEEGTLSPQVERLLEEVGTMVAHLMSPQMYQNNAVWSEDSKAMRDELGDRIVGRWVCLLGMVGRYAQAKAFVQQLPARGRMPEFIELRALMCAAIDCGEFGEAAQLYLCAPDLGVSPGDMSPLRGLMVEVVIQATKRGKAMELIKLLDKAGQSGGLGAQDGRIHAENDAQGSQTVSEHGLRVLTRSLLRSPGADEATEPAEPITAMNASTFAFSLQDDLASALRVLACLAEADPNGTVFTGVWRMMIRVAALQGLLRADTGPLAEALRGGPETIKRAFETRLAALASALSGRPMAPSDEVTRTTRERTGGIVMDRKYRKGSMENVVEEEASVWADSVVNADAAAAIHASMSSAVCLASAKVLRTSLRPAIALYEVEAAGPGSSAMARVHLADRVMRVLHNLVEMGVQPDGAVISAAILCAMQARSHSTVERILEAYKESLTPAAVSSLLKEMDRFFRHSLYASTVLQALPTLVAANVRPTPDMVASLIHTIRRTWGAHQKVACPSCAKEVDITTHEDASGVSTHVAAAPLTRSAQAGLRARASALPSTARMFSSFVRHGAAANVTGRIYLSTATRMARLEPEEGVNFSSEVGDQELPIIKGRSARNVNSSMSVTTSSMLLRALSAKSRPAAPRVDQSGLDMAPDTSVRCAGARDHDPYLAEMWPVYPSRALALLSSLGLLGGATGQNIDSNVVKALEQLGLKTSTALCGREAWTVWTTLRSLRIPLVYAPSPLASSMLRAFLIGGLQLPAWEAYMVLYGREPGALPSLAAMAARLDKDEEAAAEASRVLQRSSGTGQVAAIAAGLMQSEIETVPWVQESVTEDIVIRGAPHTVKTEPSIVHSPVMTQPLTEEVQADVGAQRNVVKVQLAQESGMRKNAVADRKQVTPTSPPASAALAKPALTVAAGGAPARYLKLDDAAAQPLPVEQLLSMTKVLMKLLEEEKSKSAGLKQLLDEQASHDAQRSRILSQLQGHMAGLEALFAEPGDSPVVESHSAFPAPVMEMDAVNGAALQVQRIENSAENSSGKENQAVPDAMRTSVQDFGNLVAGSGYARADTMMLAPDPLQSAVQSILRPAGQVGMVANTIFFKIPVELRQTIAGRFETILELVPGVVCLNKSEEGNRRYSLREFHVASDRPLSRGKELSTRASARIASHERGDKWIDNRIISGVFSLVEDDTVMPARSMLHRGTGAFSVLPVVAGIARKEQVLDLIKIKTPGGDRPLDQAWGSTLAKAIDLSLQASPDVRVRTCNASFFKDSCFAQLRRSDEIIEMEASGVEMLRFGIHLAAPSRSPFTFPKGRNMTMDELASIQDKLRADAAYYEDTFAEARQHLLNMNELSFAKPMPHVRAELRGPLAAERLAEVQAEAETRPAGSGFSVSFKSPFVFGASGKAPSLLRMSNQARKFRVRGLEFDALGKTEVAGM